VGGTTVGGAGGVGTDKHDMPHACGDDWPASAAAA
jgi:hypothetical protein